MTECSSSALEFAGSFGEDASLPGGMDDAFESINYNSYAGAALARVADAARLGLADNGTRLAKGSLGPVFRHTAMSSSELRTGDDGTITEVHLERLPGGIPKQPSTDETAETGPTFDSDALSVLPEPLYDGLCVRAPARQLFGVEEEPPFRQPSSTTAQPSDQRVGDQPKTAPQLKTQEDHSVHPLPEMVPRRASPQEFCSDAGFGSTLRWCPLANSLPQGQAPKHEIEVGSLEWTMVSDQLQRGSGTQQAGSERRRASTEDARPGVLNSSAS